MSYSHYSLKRVMQQFSLDVREEKGTFASLTPLPVRDAFAEALAEALPLAVSINTEKARSALLIMSVLLELRRHFARQISLFSGTEFVGDADAGLSGFCDFLISLSPRQLFVTAPVIAVVEAKNENLVAGLGQCVAEMLGATRFNEREGNILPVVYGTVTSGVDWLFLRLEQNTATIDLQEYSLEDAGRVLGILSAMVEQKV